MVTENTDVTLCSLALNKISESPITSLDDQDDVAGTCSRIWPSLGDYLLSLYPWPFALDKRQLAIAPDEQPLNEHLRAFALPANMLDGPFAVYGDGSSNPSHGWEIYGNFLYCDFDTVIIDYKKRPEVREYPGYYYEFAATALAAELAMPVSESENRAGEMRIKAFGPAQMDGQGGMFAACRRIASQNQPTKSLFQNGNPLMRARGGGGF